MQTVLKTERAISNSLCLFGVAAEEQTLKGIASSLKGNTENVAEKVEQLQSRSKQLEKELEALKAKLASSAGSDLAGQAKDVNGVKVLAARLDGADVNALRTTMDQLKNKLGSALIMLAAENDGKVTLLAGVTKDLIKSAKAGDAVKACAEYVDGRGGGKPEMAQAGGQKPAGIDDALAAFEKWAEGVL